MSNSLLPGVGRSLFGVVLLSVALSVGLYGVFMSMTNESFDDGGALFSQDDIYLDECGACHLAYPPGLLPEPSWRLLLAHLDDHFGDNAELGEDERLHLEKYLRDEALQYGKPTTMSRMLRNLPDDPFIRITELPNFILDHQTSVVNINAETTVGSGLGDCEVCHTNALQGRFVDPIIPATAITN